jgi:hypothetical protein
MISWVLGARCLLLPARMFWQEQAGLLEGSKFENLRFGSLRFGSSEVQLFGFQQNNSNE